MAKMSKSNLKTMLQWDFKLQMKYGIIPVYGIVTIIYILILWFFPVPSSELSTLIQFMIFTDPVLLGFLFCAGLVYFEKSENVLQALVTTPMKGKNYLLSKVLSLTIMAIIVSVLIAIFPYAIENDFNWFNILWLVSGVGVTAAVGILVGFIIGSKYSTFNEYLLMSMPYILLFMIPLLGFMGLTEEYWFYYLFPTQGSLFLIKATWTSIETWKIIYSIIYLIVWCVILFYLGLKSYKRYFLIEQGGKRVE